MKLTREHFSNTGYTISTKNGVWMARLTKRFENGDEMFSNITVTNIMYPDEFCISGEISGYFSINSLTIKTVEELEMVYKLGRIYYHKGLWKRIVDTTTK